MAKVPFGNRKVKVLANLGGSDRLDLIAEGIRRDRRRRCGATFVDGLRRRHEDGLLQFDGALVAQNVRITRTPNWSFAIT